MRSGSGEKNSKKTAVSARVACDVTIAVSEMLAIYGLITPKITVSAEHAARTVNSPILFNIYTCDILKLFDINVNGNTRAIAFADDVIVYTAAKTVSEVYPALEEIVEKMRNHPISQATQADNFLT